MNHMMQQGNGSVEVIPSVIQPRDVKSDMQSTDYNMDQRLKVKDHLLKKSGSNFVLVGVLVSFV